MNPSRRFLLLFLLVSSLPAALAIVPASSASAVPVTLTWRAPVPSGPHVVPPAWTVRALPNGTVYIGNNLVNFSSGLPAASSPTSFAYTSTSVQYTYTLAHSCVVSANYTAPTRSSPDRVKVSYFSTSCPHAGTYPVSFLNKKAGAPLALNSTGGVSGAICQIRFGSAYFSWCGDAMTGAKMQYAASGNSYVVELVTNSPTWSIDPSLVQTNTCSSGSASSLTCAFSTNVAGGDGLAFIITSQGAYASVTISDTLGNSFVHTSASFPYGGTVSGYSDSYYVSASKSGGADTVSWSNSNTDGAIEIAIFELSTSVSIDTISTGTGTSASTSVTSFSPSAGDFIVAVGITDGRTCTAPSGFTLSSGTYFCTPSVSGFHFGGYVGNYGGGSTTASFSLGSSDGFSEIAAAFVTPVTETITITPANGFVSTTQNAVLSGCISNTNILVNSQPHPIGGVVPNVSCVLTVPTDNTSARFRFASESTTQTWTSGTSGDTKFFTIYAEEKLTASYSAVSGSPSGNALVLSYTHSGGAATYTLTTSAAAVWPDYNGGAGYSVGATYIAGGRHSSDQNTTSYTASATVVFSIYRQWGLTLSYSAVSGTPCAGSKAFAATQYGSALAYTLTGAATLKYVDDAKAYTAGDCYVSSAERYSSNQNGTAAAGSTVVFSVYHQYRFVTSIYTSKPYASTLASGNYATITFTQYGSAGATAHLWDASQATVWADAGGAVSSLSPTSSASNSTTRWAAFGFVQINPVSGSGTIAASFYEQESVQFCATVLTGGNAFTSSNYAKAVYKQFNGTTTLSPVGLSCQTDWVDWGSSGQSLAGISKLSSQSGTGERWRTYATNATKVNTHGIVETYQFQDELHSVTVQLEASDGTVAHSPSSYTIQGNNGTSLAKTSVLLSWASRGTQTLTASTWEGTNVEPSPAPTCSVSTHDSDCAFTVKIYDVTLAFQDAGGTALKARPSTYTLTFPNSTQLAVQGSHVSILVQLGTTSLSSIRWEGSTLKPLSALSFDASTNQSPSAKFPVYSLDAKYTDAEGYSLTSANSYVSYTFPNSTVIHYPKSGVGGTDPTWSKWLNFTQVQNGTTSISVYWRAYDVKDSSVNLQSDTIALASTTVWLNMGGSGTEMYVSTSDAVVNRIWDPNFDVLYYKITSTSTTLFMRIWLGSLPVPQDVSVDGNLFYSNIPAVWTSDASLNMIVVHVQGDIIVDFKGNLAAKTAPIGTTPVVVPFQTVPPNSQQQIPPPSGPSFQFPDVVGALDAYASSAALLFFRTMPYSLAFPFVLLVLLALALTRPTRGRGRPYGYTGPVVVVERGRGFSLLLTMLTLSVGSVATGLSVEFVFPALGWIPRPTVPWQVLTLTFVLVAAVGFLLSYFAVTHARGSRGEVKAE